MKSFQGSYLHHCQQGVTLLEVMIAVLVLSIGLLGVAGLQSTSVRHTNSTYERTMSIILTDMLSELMRSDPDMARTGGYTLTDCSGNSALGTDIWVQDVKRATHEETCPMVIWDAENMRYVITIAWDDERIGTSSMVTQVRL